MIDQPTKYRYPKWGRAQFQELCAECKRTIEDGERVLRLRLGEGTLCANCGPAREREGGR